MQRLREFSLSWYPCTMTTVTVSKKKFEQLERQAALYTRVLKQAEKQAPTEVYSTTRLNEFLREDRLTARARGIVKKLLAVRSR